MQIASPSMIANMPKIVFIVSKLFVTNQYSTSNTIAALMSRDVKITTTALAWSEREYEVGNNETIKLIKNKVFSLLLGNNKLLGDSLSILLYRLQSGLQIIGG